MAIVTKTSGAATYIDHENQDDNFGHAGALYIRGSSGKEKHCLIDFGLTGTTTADLVYGQLKVYVNTNTGGNLVFNVHRVLVGWNEAQATWRVPKSGTVWGVEGMLADTDYNSVVIGTGTMSTAPGWLTVDITNLAELKAMVAAGTSYGLVLRYAGETGGSHIFRAMTERTRNCFVLQQRRWGNLPVRLRAGVRRNYGKQEAMI